MAKRYGQYCGLARALDVVGDRWNLLIVRELLVGPARYRDLLDGLGGVATNLLADRLRELTAAGVVERRLADGPSAVEYALTPWGAALREPVEALIRWSMPLMAPGPNGDRFRVQWLVVALPALLAGRRSPDGATAVGVVVEGETVQVVATPAGIEVTRHDGRALDALVRADGSTVLELAAGAYTLDGALARGAVEISGDRAAARTVFDAPTASVASTPDHGRS